MLRSNAGSSSGEQLSGVDARAADVVGRVAPAQVLAAEVVVRRVGIGRQREILARAVVRVVAQRLQEACSQPDKYSN